MATTNLGKVAVVPRGEYDANVQYEKLDIVQYERQSYLVKQSVLGVIPSTGSEYVLLAGRGDSSYEVAVKNGYVGTESEWLLYIKADGSIQALQQFMTNPAETAVQVPDYGTIPSLQGHVKRMFENGSLPATPFATKALMTASALVDGKYAMVTDDTVNNGLYVKTAGVWVKSEYDPVLSAKVYTDNKIKPLQNVFDTRVQMIASSLVTPSYAIVVNDPDPTKNGFYQGGNSSYVKVAYKPLEQAKSYTDNLLSTKLTTTTNLNDLLTGTYYISSPDMNTIFDDGTFATLGYPLKMVRGGGAIVEVTRSAGNGTLSFQKLTYTSQGKLFTRSGVVGGDFTTWAKASGGGSGTYESEALGLINAEDGDTFWVYPTPENGIIALTLYKRLNATTSEVVYTQTNPLDEYLITQNTKWEIV